MKVRAVVTVVVLLTANAIPVPAVDMHKVRTIGDSEEMRMMAGFHKPSIIWEKKISHSRQVTESDEPQCMISSDNNCILISDRYSVFRYDSSGRYLWKYTPANGEYVYLVGVSSDGRRVLCSQVRETEAADGEGVSFDAVLLNGSDGSVVLAHPLEGEAYPTSLSADGKTFIASSCIDESYLTVDAFTSYAVLIDDKGRVLWRSDSLKPVPLDAVACSRISDDNKYVLLGTRDRLTLVDRSGRRYFDIRLNGFTPTISHNGRYVLLTGLVAAGQSVSGQASKWPEVLPVSKKRYDSNNAAVADRLTDVAALVEIELPQESDSAGKGKPRARVIWRHKGGEAGNGRACDEVECESRLRAITYGSQGFLGIISQFPITGKQVELFVLNHKQQVVGKKISIPQTVALGKVGVSGDGKFAYIYRELSSEERAESPDCGSELAVLDRQGQVYTRVLLPEYWPASVCISDEGRFVVAASQKTTRCYKLF